MSGPISSGPTSATKETWACPDPGSRQQAAGVSEPSLERLAIHTVTTKPWDLETAIEKYAKAGVGGISVWRDTVAGRDRAGLVAAGRRIRDAGLAPVSLVRGGFFASADRDRRKRAIEENRVAIREAEVLGLPAIVLVCGADPHQSNAESRSQTVDALRVLAPEARNAGVRLLVEPLHPMYADTRSAVNSLADANDVCGAVGDTAVGVAVDVYHVWWESDLKREIERCGANGWIGAFHVCDWKVPTDDMLLDRGAMGEGCIDIPQIRSWVESAGFIGPIEVEIFSKTYWNIDQEHYLARIVRAYQEYV